MRNLLLGPVALLFAAGCYPTLPPHIAEGTEVLKPGGVSLTVAGGGAGFDANVSPSAGTQSSAVGAGGLEARVRVGVGAKQEVGVSAFLGVGSPSGGSDPPFAAGGKLSYKVAPVPWLAFVADVGAFDHAAASIGVVGGDLAAIFAPYTAENGSQLYFAAKGGFAVPFLTGARDMNESFEIPIGFAFHTSERVRFFVEGGPVLGFAQLVTDAAPDTSQNATSFGAYGIVAFAFVLR